MGVGVRDDMYKYECSQEQEEVIGSSVSAARANTRGRGLAARTAGATWVTGRRWPSDVLLRAWHRRAKEQTGLHSFVPVTTGG